MKSACSFIGAWKASVVWLLGMEFIAKNLQFFQITNVKILCTNSLSIHNLTI